MDTSTCFRRGVVASIALVLFLAAGVAGAGEAIRVIMAQNIWTDAVRERIPAFERETGIKIRLESFEEEQLGRKLIAEMSAGADLDVFVTRPLNDGLLFASRGWYADLTPFIDNDPDYDFSDFTPGSRAATRIGGIQTCIPTSNETHVVYYRKDIFKEKGIAPPRTLDELAAAAERLTDRERGFYGVLMRGSPSPLVTQFSSFLYSCGGDWFDPATRRATFDTPQALAAVELYGGLLRKYGPDDAQTMSWPQMMAYFQEGRGAMYIDASAHYPMLLDPAKSDLAERTGILPFPAGSAGRRPYRVTAMGMAIYAGSEKKESAWRFIRYMTEKERMASIQGEYGYQCARQSAFLCPEGTRNFPPELLAALDEQMADAVHYDRPLVISVAQARNILGAAVSMAVTGGDYRQAMRTANRRFQALLDAED